MLIVLPYLIPAGLGNAVIDERGPDDLGSDSFRDHAKVDGADPANVYLRVVALVGIEKDEIGIADHGKSHADRTLTLFGFFRMIFDCMGDPFLRKIDLLAERILIRTDDRLADFALNFGIYRAGFLPESEGKFLVMFRIVGRGKFLELIEPMLFLEVEITFLMTRPDSAPANGM